VAVRAGVAASAVPSGGGRARVGCRSGCRCAGVVGTADACEGVSRSMQIARKRPPAHHSRRPSHLGSQCPLPSERWASPRICCSRRICQTCSSVRR
jgi:hypothetical protein